MADLMEEVQSILGRAPEKPKGEGAVTEMKDPSDEARDLLNTHTNLSKMIQKKLDAVSAAMGSAKKQAERLDRVGSGKISAPDLLGAAPLRALQDLSKMVSGAVSHVEKTIKNAKRGSGSMGFREDQESYLDWLDARVDSLSEVRKPMPDSAPDNAGVNDYSAELAAAAQQAAGYISTPAQLKIGSSVHIGRKSLAVVGPPKMTSQGMLIHLEPPESEKAHLNTADAYTLMIPFEGETSAPPKMGSAQQTVQPTAEAVLTLGDRSVTILAADLRLESGDYGDHMTNYGDYGPAMGRIKPGDKVSGILTPTVFRVIGKSGNSALVQPDSMDSEMYGRYKAASQYARTPVGQGVPSVPSVDQWKPGMGRIPAGADFPGRGGKSVQDTSTSAPATTPTSQDGMSGSGSRTSFAGTRVLNYNPHSGKYQMVTGKKPGEYEMADTIQIVGHDPSLPTAVGESMTLDRFEHALDEAAGDSVIAKLEAVVESGEVQKVNGVLMEPAVASVMIQLYRSVNEANQSRMGAMGVHEMLDVSQKMLVRLTEAAPKPQSSVKKKVEPHMWVIVKQAKDKYLVSIGDPKKTSSKAKFMGSKADLQVWARDNIGKKVSADHIIDLSGEKLVPDTYSQWYVDTQMKGGKGSKKEETELGEGKGMKPGRFEKLKKSIAAKGDVEDPAAVAASIGRKKYGKDKFQKMAAAGKKEEEVETALFFRNGRSAESALEALDLEGVEHELAGEALMLLVSEEKLGELCMELSDAHFSFELLDEALKKDEADLNRP